jgi:hypothetical protein
MITSQTLIRFKVIMGGYILLRVFGGFNDCICTLERTVSYALKENRTIIWSPLLYTATNFHSIFDFSEYPVRVLCGEKCLEDISWDAIEPKCYKNRLNGHSISYGNPIPGQFSIDGELSQYDPTNSHPETTLLVNHSGRGGCATFKDIKFKPEFLKQFYKQLDVFPENYVAIHLRATDYPGFNEESDIEKVNVFVKKHPGVQIYIACDNSELTEKLCDMHPQLVRPLSYKVIDEKYHALHYKFGRTDPACLINALIDILMCACADDFLQSRGGFSILIAQLRNNPDLLKKLIAYEGDDTVQPDVLDGAKEATTEDEDTVQPDELDSVSQTKEPTTEDEDEEEQSHPNEDTIQPDESASLC